MGNKKHPTWAKQAAIAQAAIDKRIALREAGIKAGYQVTTTAVKASALPYSTVRAKVSKGASGKVGMRELSGVPLHVQLKMRGK